MFDPAQPPRLLVTIVPRTSTGYTVNLGVNVTHVAVMDLATGETATTVYGAHHDTSPQEVVQHLVSRTRAEDPSWSFTAYDTFPLPGGRTLVHLY